MIRSEDNRIRFEDFSHGTAVVGDMKPQGVAVHVADSRKGPSKVRRPKNLEAKVQKACPKGTEATEGDGKN